MSRSIIRVSSSAPRLDLAAKKPASLQSEMEADNAERVRLYHSARWLKARRQFLAEHPLCAECEKAGVIEPATAVDHVDGHQLHNWRQRFWIESGWQALCQLHHAQKSARELAEWRRGVVASQKPFLQGPRAHLRGTPAADI